MTEFHKHIIIIYCIGGNTSSRLLVLRMTLSGLKNVVRGREDFSQPLGLRSPDPNLIGFAYQLMTNNLIVAAIKLAFDPR